MRRRSSLLLAVALVLTTAAAAHAAPLPVRSEDDQDAALANRIDAVTNTVAVMSRRIARIGGLVGVAPGPPNAPLLEAQAQALALAALAEDLLCPAGRTGAGGAAAVIADDDRHADDASATGLANQAQAVATVLAQAGQRLARAAEPFYVNPGPPNDPEAAALTALYAEAAAIVNQISILLGSELRAPPSPC